MDYKPFYSLQPLFSCWGSSKALVLTFQPKVVALKYEVCLNFQNFLSFVYTYLYFKRWQLVKRLTFCLEILQVIASPILYYNQIIQFCNFIDAIRHSMFFVDGILSPLKI
eukprot:TRINITY_DN5877_c2_g1_i1.p5 TRINITY_DN5877_c2_g1~~TRINITY_DN5877_c2_g1_i1.p5  ORF type:complete len:110 (-),score=0.06 TRINITY_DN5877_c2_g1_i1:520-849(-)